jgi:phosphatidate phosphatase APP1
MIARRNDAPGETVCQLTIAQTLAITVPNTQVRVYDLGDTHVVQQAERQGQIVNPFWFNVNTRVWHSIPLSSQS